MAVFRAFWGLGVEDHLDIVPFFRPAPVQGEKLQILPEDADVVKAPGEEHRVLAAPGVKLLHGLREGNPLRPEPGFLDAGELADPAVEMPVVFGDDHHLKFIPGSPPLIQPDGTHLNDLPPDGHGQHLFGRGGTGPGLIPLHI